MVLPLKITRPLSTPLYQALQRAGSQLVRSSRMENIPLGEVPMVKILGEARGTRSSENTENIDRGHKDRDREHKDGERKHRSKDHEIPLRIKGTESDGRGPHKSSRRSAPESEAGSTTKSSTTRSSTTKSSRTTSNRSYDEEPDSGSETETEKRSRDKRSHGRSRKAESEY